MRLGRRLAPYGLTGPGALWLVVFFLIPMFAMLVLSLETPLPTVGFKQAGYQFTWHFSQYSQAWSQYHVQFVRSLVYAGIVTAVTLVVGYPVAYWIAFKGGTQKTTYLFLILLPFFVSFVIRSLAWQFILSSDGIVFSDAEADGTCCRRSFHVLATPTAVISGIAYNFAPLHGAAAVRVAGEGRPGGRGGGERPVRLEPAGLPAGRSCPLSIPGIFAGFLLTFIPAVGDYVNNDILGGTNTTMIGNIVQREFLNDQNYPLASALSFILMIGLMIGIFDLRPRPRDPTASRSTCERERRNGRAARRSNWRRLPHRTPKRSWKRHILRIYTKLVIAYLLIPILVMILYSFNANSAAATQTSPKVSFRWQGFTVAWWKTWNAIPDLTSALGELAVDRGHQHDRRHDPRHADRAGAGALPVPRVGHARGGHVHEHRGARDRARRGAAVVLRAVQLPPGTARASSSPT